MDKINWINGQTPINQTNLNQMQTNVETALNEVLANNSVVVSPTEPSTGRNKVWLQHNKKNMLNLRITNATIGSQGQSITDNASTRLCFDYIEVKSNLEITFSANTSTDFMGLAFYDSSRTFLSREYTNGTSQITRTTPSNTKYVKPFIQISSATMNSSSVNQYGMQLENGSQRTTVEAIVEDKAYILNSNNIYEEFYNEENINQKCYSLYETRIGTWIDGKPLYRKVFEININSSNTSIETNISSINLDTLVNIYGSSKYGNYKRNIFNNYAYSGSLSEWSGAYINGNTLVFRNYNLDLEKAYITLEYTKTTD